MFLISLLAVSSLLLLSATAPVVADEGDHTITIKAELGAGNVFDKLTINLEPNTEYTIIFVNEQAAGHNLRIDVNDNIEDNGDVADSGDITIGLANDATGAGAGTWNGTWTTPADGEYLFYCGFLGHYTQGMEGVFVVGEGDAPGFGFFFAFSALAITALAVPRLRKN
jgi:plastocyanin